MTPRPVPPHDLDAERAVLGALLSGAPLADVHPLASADFYRPAHQLIYEASHNAQLIDMIATAGVFEWRIRVESARRLGSSYPSGVTLGDHRGIVEALEARDGTRAETLMREHVTTAAHRHLDVVAEDESLGEGL